MHLSAKVDKLKNLKLVKNQKEFNEALDLFLDDELKDERNILYKEHLDMGISMPEFKNNYLKKIFSEYIRESLSNALILVNNNQKLEAKKILDNIYKLKPIFKEYDIVNYPEFISNAENNINEQEVELLFLEPVINKKEINQITSAFISALSKKSTQHLDKMEFQQKFYTHPLIPCLDLDAYSDIVQIEKSIENETLQLGIYKNLIKAMLLHKEKINAESLQGFITFVISEDLTKGFSNILKNDNYKPMSLKNLLNEIIQGKDLSNEIIQDIIQEIKLDYTTNLALNKNAELSKLISSTFSLNDYGFDVFLNKYNTSQPKLFFHGHATENAGANQREQQNNTAHILRDFKYDTLGLTVLKDHVINVEHHRRYLHNYSSLMDFTKQEEIILTSLQFDASYAKTLALDENVHKIETTDLISSNQFIVKSDISRSQKFIANSLGKNDLDLICERKNAYCFLINKNRNFFKQVLSTTGTNNELSYQLMVKPLLEFTNCLLNIEKEKEIRLFTKQEIELLQDMLTVKIPNADLRSLQQTVNKELNRREEKNLKYIEVEKFTDLINLGINDVTIKSVKESNNKYKEHTRFINDDKNSLSEVLVLLEEKEIDNSYGKAYKTRVINALKTKIEKEAVKLLNYNNNKKEFLLENLSQIMNQFEPGSSIHYFKTDWKLNKYQGSELDVSRTLAELFKTDGKSNEKISNERTILNSLFKLAQLNESQIVCNTKVLENKNKNKI